MVNKTDVIFALVGHAVCVHVFMMGIGTRDWTRRGMARGWAWGVWLCHQLEEQEARAFSKVPKPSPTPREVGWPGHRQFLKLPR